jgi:hypothetical protein
MKISIYKAFFGKKCVLLDFLIKKVQIRPCFVKNISKSERLCEEKFT